MTTRSEKILFFDKDQGVWVSDTIEVEQQEESSQQEKEESNGNSRKAYL